MYAYVGYDYTYESEPLHKLKPGEHITTSQGDGIVESVSVLDTAVTAIAYRNG